MDLSTFRKTVPESRRRQSERMQISGFLTGNEASLSIQDIEYGEPDPPDFVLTLDSGMRQPCGVKILCADRSRPGRS